MSISAASYAGQLTVTEVPPTNEPALAAGQSLLYNAFNRSHAFDGTNGPQPTLLAQFQEALSSGAATIDLTSMLGTNGATVNGNGLQVIAALFSNPAANANPITIGVGASNGYQLLGASWKVTLAPGNHIVFDLTNAGTTKTAPVIGGSAKTMDLAGTGAQALNVEILLG
jgi:hypothetical protein